VSRYQFPGTGSGSATTDASLLTSGTLADARLSSNVALENVANVFTAQQQITPASNSPSTVRLNQANGTHSLSLGTLIASNVFGAIWAGPATPDDTNYAIASNNGTTILNVGAGGTLSLRVANVPLVGVSATTINSSIPFTTTSDVTARAFIASQDGAQVSYYASGGIRKSTGGVWFYDAPFADGQFVFRTGTGFTERMRLSTAGNLTVTGFARFSSAPATANSIFVGNDSDRVEVGYDPAGVTLGTIQAQVIADASGNLYLSSRTNNGSSVLFWTHNGTISAERARISPSGGLSVGAVNDAGAGNILVSGTVMLGGSAGPILRNNSGTIEARNNANSAGAPFGCTNLTASGTGSLGSLVVTNGTTLGVRTIAALPLAVVSAGQSFRVSDSPVTANRIVTSDGTDWHYEGLPYNVGTKVAGTIVIKIDTTTTGQKNLFIPVPYACTIISWELASVGGVVGSVVVDVWKDTYANYPPVNADSITGSAKPTLTASDKAQSSTLTGWTTSIAAGDYIEVEVESVTTITSVTLTLNVERVS